MLLHSSLQKQITSTAQIAKKMSSLHRTTAQNVVRNLIGKYLYLKYFYFFIPYSEGFMSGKLSSMIETANIREIPCQRSPGDVAYRLDDSGVTMMGISPPRELPKEERIPGQ